MLDIGLFKSGQEKQLFEAFVAGKEPDYLSLYFTSDSSQDKALLDNARSRIEYFIAKSEANKKGFRTKLLNPFFAPPAGLEPATL